MRKEDTEKDRVDHVRKHSNNAAEIRDWRTSSHCRYLSKSSKCCRRCFPLSLLSTQPYFDGVNFRELSLGTRIGDDTIYITVPPSGVVGKFLR